MIKERWVHQLLLVVPTPESAGGRGKLLARRIPEDRVAVALADREIKRDGGALTQHGLVRPIHDHPVPRRRGAGGVVPLNVRLGRRDSLHRDGEGRALTRNRLESAGSGDARLGRQAVGVHRARSRRGDGCVNANASDASIRSVDVVVVAVNGGFACHRRSHDTSLHPCTDLAGRAEIVTTLISMTVAVVVDAVADLGRARVHAGLTLHAVSRRNEAVVVGVVVAGCNHAVAVTIVVADVANSIVIEVSLVGVDHQRAVVDAVEHAVAVNVGVAGVASAVLVFVELGVIRHERAVIDAVEHAIVVDVGVADVAESVVVGVKLVGVGHHGAVVDAVEHGVAVNVGVAGVACAVLIEVRLVGVGDRRAVVVHVVDAVAVRVILARVAGTVVVRVELVGVDHQRAVVDAVEDPVVVIVGVADVAHAVVVVVELVGVGDEWTVVDVVGDFVTIDVVVARVSRAVAIRVELSSALVHESLRPAEIIDFVLRDTEHGSRSPRLERRSDFETVNDVVAREAEIDRGRVELGLAVVCGASAISV